MVDNMETRDLTLSLSNIEPLIVRPNIHPVPNISADVKLIISEQKHLQKRLAKDQTYEPLHKDKNVLCLGQSDIIFKI